MKRSVRRCASLVVEMICAAILLCAGLVQAQQPPSEDEGNPGAHTDKPLTLDLSFLWDSHGEGEPSWIIAKVNDEIVSRGEALERIRGELESLARSYPADQFQRKAMERWRKSIRELVEEKLFLQVGKAEDITVSEADIDKGINEEIKKVGGDAKYKQNLDQLGTTPAKHRDQVRKDLTVREVLLRKIGAKGSINMNDPKARMPKDPYVTPSEIRAFYDERKKDYYIEEKVAPRQIILKYRDSQSRAVAEQEAESCERLLAAGADFGLLAHWISAVYAAQDGLWQESPRGTFPEEIEKVLFSLKVNEISPVVESEQTFRILRVESRTQSQQRTFEEVQDEIKKALQNHRLMSNWDEVKRELKKNAFIWPPELARDSRDK